MISCVNLFPVILFSRCRHSALVRQWCDNILYNTLSTVIVWLLQAAGGRRPQGDSQAEGVEGICFLDISQNTMPGTCTIHKNMPFPLAPSRLPQLPPQPPSLHPSATTTATTCQLRRRSTFLKSLSGKVESQEQQPLLACWWSPRSWKSRGVQELRLQEASGAKGHRYPANEKKECCWRVKENTAVTCFFLTLQWSLQCAQHPLFPGKGHSPESTKSCPRWPLHSKPKCHSCTL